MTVGEVQAFQNRLVADGRASSACGKYQIIRKTLAALVANGAAAKGDLFDQKTQDKLAVALMMQRSLNRFLENKISAEDLALNLAKEWASMPVPKDVFNGKRNVKAGQSFYAGDGLNMALVKVPEFLAAIRAIRP